MLRRVCFAGALLALLTVAPAAEALVSLDVVATESRPASVSAERGRLAWSSYRVASGSYRLKLSFRGRTRTLPIRSRRAPFDVDLGSGPDGRLYAVYSRCRDEAALEGCDLYRTRLPGGPERRLRSVSTRGASEHHPSLSGSRLAFVRERATPSSRPTAAAPKTAMGAPTPTPPALVLPLARPRLMVTDLRTGALRRVAGSTGPRASFTFTALELRGRDIAYVTSVVHPRRGSASASAFGAVDVRRQLRLARLDRPGVRIVEDFRFTTFGPELLSPAFRGGTLLYGLDHRISELRSYRLRDGRRHRTRLPGPTVSIAADASDTWLMKGADRQPQFGDPCSIGFTDVLIGEIPGTTRLPRLCTVARIRGLASG